MKEVSSTKKIAFAAMFAALTLLATYVIKLPTPTMGYIHIGDTFVLLSGVFLGPWLGALAAGIGSALSDLIGGYMIWVPGTFVIKFFTAMVAALLYRALVKVLSNKKAGETGAFIISGIVGEAVMVFGYFLFNVIVVMAAGGSAGTTTIASAFAASLAEIPFNIVQGVVGIVLGTLLRPVLAKASRKVLAAA